MVCKPEVDLESALDRLIDAGLLFRLGLPPQCDLPGAEQHLSLINSRILQSAVVIAKGRADAAARICEKGWGSGSARTRRHSFDRNGDLLRNDRLVE